MRGAQHERWRAAQRLWLRGSPEQWLVGIAGTIASIVLHILLITVVVWGEGGTRIHRQSREGLGANSIAADEEATATLIFIEDPAPGAPEESPLELPASAGKVQQSLRLTIISPDASLDRVLDDSESDESTPPASEDSASDREGRAALFGRYIGQIQARVERAWLRPRTPIGAEAFECRVQVLQNQRGEIMEVTLQQCNGDADWQLSLVQAIESASPLPAPPDPRVFADSLQLSFSSHAYVPEASADGFVPAPSILMTAE